MKKIPFLTIGIASYNYAGYLLKAFEQIKKQQFTDFEVLYCDDGSTDDSVSIIESLIRNNPDMNIRLIKGENEGILANRNRIIQNARGKYLLICDADDYMSDNCVVSLCMAAKEKDADCVIGGFSEVDGRGNVYKSHIPEKTANKWIYIWHHAQIYKLEIVRKNNLFFSRIPDDVCFVQRIHQYAENTVFVSENVYFWIRHADSTSRGIDTNLDWHPTRLWKNIVDCILEIQKELSSEEDIWPLRYFLYKWFYLNITDQPIGNRENLKYNIKALQQDMRRICPRYRRVSFFIRILSEKDTLFARIAILICWELEGLGCTQLLPIIRSKQWKLHA